jgi:hypothetical protein
MALGLTRLKGTISYSSTPTATLTSSPREFRKLLGRFFGRSHGSTEQDGDNGRWDFGSECLSMG